jgi:hypothetical protein
MVNYENLKNLNYPLSWCGWSKRCNHGKGGLLPTTATDLKLLFIKKQLLVALKSQKWQHFE